MKSPASTAIDAKIQQLNDAGDWRGATLAHARKLIHAADPDILEEWKWVKPTNPGTPVFSHAGIICTGETHKNVVKLTFARGASLPDPAHLFNASLEGNARRAIDLHRATPSTSPPSNPSSAPPPRSTSPPNPRQNPGPGRSPPAPEPRLQTTRPPCAMLSPKHALPHPSRGLPAHAGALLSLSLDL